MNIEVSPNLVNLLGYWGKVVVGSLAVFGTLVHLRSDLSTKRYAIFNVWSFAFTLCLDVLIIDQLFKLSFQISGPQSWRPFYGINLLYYFIFSDWIFYLYHRFVHTIPIFWTGHFAHHSGSKMHLSLILRESILSHVFTLPFALLGIPLGLQPIGVVAMIRLIIFYQSFLHFNVKSDIPMLKHILVTPFNHILHHSIEFQGAGHNFGGILNVWDRLCGTYSDNKMYLGSYGVPGKPEKNSIWYLNVKPVIDLAKECVEKKSFRPLLLPSGLKRRAQENWVTYFFYSAIFCLFLFTVLSQVPSKIR